MPATQYPAANIPGAALRFPADQYATLPNVPVFREHQTRAVDGRMLKFGMQQLQMVCDRSNRRIAETGDYAAIVIGHTPDPAEHEAPQPELVGYAGPFRMGTIGEGERKCWAILADFHIFRADLAKVRKHPRRSPELCLEDSYEEMFLDPIALLGAEAPRLDLGLLTGAVASDGASLPTEPETARRLYSFERQGRRVEKYAMAACASPSASNVFAPQKADISPKQPQHYAAQTPQRTTSMLSPEDISAVVEAFLATDAGQFLVEEMKAKQGTNAIVEPSQEPPAAPAVPAEPMAEPPAPAAEPTAEPPAADMPPLPEGGEPAPKEPEELPEAHGEPDGDEPAKKYAAACASADGLSDEHLEKYLSQRWKNHPKWKKYAAECGTIQGKEGGKPAAGEVTQETGDPAGNGSAPPAKELKPTQLYSRLQGELQSMKGELAAERTARRQVERYSRLQGLSGEYLMDPQDELELTRDMSEAQFERHVEKTIREHYQRNPVGLPWASPPDAMSTNRDPSHPGNTPKETTEKEAAKAVERYQRKRAAGETCDFAAILEEVKAGK